MNYDALTSELVRALRGRRSQGAINRKLGRSSNAVHAWEHGSRSPRASDFFKLGRLAGVDVAHVLAQFTDAPAQPPRALDANVGAERLARPALPPKSQYSYNLFAISDQGLEQIRQAHLQYYERVRAIVAECEHPTRLALLNVQLLPLDA